MNQVVLLVNCATDEREMYAEYLRFAGFQAVESCDPDEAMELAATMHPDVVVSALGSSERHDVTDLIRRFRLNASTRHLPIIVVTGYVFDADRERAFAAGCDVFLPKPLLPDVLAQEVRRAATSGRQRAYVEGGE